MRRSVLNFRSEPLALVGPTLHRRSPFLTAAFAISLLSLTANRGAFTSPSDGVGSVRLKYGADGTPSAPIAGSHVGFESGAKLVIPKIILICLDTVRADALGPWAIGEPLMPETSEWLKTATVFRDAHSAAPWTGPSMTSLLTGLLPSNHGVRAPELDARLAPSIATLAEILRQSGRACDAFTGGGWVSETTGILDGFRQVSAPFSFGADSKTLVESQRGRAAADAHESFMLLHSYEAHDPYGGPLARAIVGLRPELTPVQLAAIDAEAEQDGGRSLTRRFLLDPGSRAQVFDSAIGRRRRTPIVAQWFEHGLKSDPKGAELVAEARRAYDTGLRWLDHVLAAYLNAADAAHVFDDAVVILCADHGEGFGEHGTLHHGRRVYAELTHVPLAIRAPGFPRGAVIDGTCSLVDVAPTILELCGLPQAEGSDGRSLVSLAHGTETATRLALSEELRTPEQTGTNDDVALAAVRDRQTTWIGTRNRRTGVLTEEVFDRATDPAEERPLAVDTALGRAGEDLRRAVERLRRDGVR